MNKKVIAIALVLTFAFGIAINTKALTVEELTASIVALQAQIAAMSGTPVAPAAAACNFSTDLKQGMTNASVKLLQEKLGVDNTGYFGALTLKAVKAYQTTSGISPVSGYVGSLTRAKLNTQYCSAVVPPVVPPVSGFPAGCTSAVGFSSTTGLPCASTSTFPTGCTSAVGYSSTTGLSCATSTPSSSGEASLTVTNAGVYMVSSLRGGDIGKTVLGLKVKVTNGNATLNRLDVQLSDPAAFKIMPWRAIKSMSLYDGSTLLKTVDTSSMATWQEVLFAKYYVMRFEDVGLSIAKDTSKVLTVTVDMLDTPMVTAPAGLNASIRFENPKLSGVGGAINSIRATDSTGLTQYAVYGTANTVNLTQTTLMAVLQATSNTSTPKAGVILGNIVDSVSDLEVFKLDVKSQNSASTIKTIDFNVSQVYVAGGTSMNNIAAVKLYDGGVLVASSYVEDATAGALPAVANRALVVGVHAGGDVGFNDDVVRFADLSIELAKDVIKTLTVKVDIKPVDGTIVKAGDAMTIGFRAMSVVDANYNAPVSPAVVAGYAQTIYVDAATLAFLSASINPTKMSTTPWKESASGDIKFTVRANNGDIYVKNDGTAITAALQTTAGAGIAAPGVPAVTTTINGGYSSSDAEAGAGAAAGYYIVRNGTTKNFTYSYTIEDSLVTKQVVTVYNGAKLTGFIWTTMAAGALVAPPITFGASMLNDYKTDIKPIN
ncbi:MAG: peptidoglycan-binding domain-containing protein [Candidatus Parcubacteria bacterium]|nr:peptidoglycan-binding domain-containing protein [Candidatus Parcubacteria bacterium]